ncbi:hypothetical protein LPC08_18325 [Roseomonas sp. OT10]|uniref:hypothetical protein n=1 Tax=Roseomonas cutis TaxID=2897332 RepID=UPI001E4F38D9|nr:hypothetical protein [Roseomonas sp. OT10]UFN47952.1 hypothetical protein LPC08_18325 [Roseomonas sp. OT10]
MRRALALLGAALAGAALLAAAYVALFNALVPPAPGSIYREVLLADAPGPRLIVDSGSNGLYGLDATELGRGLNRVGITASDNAGYNLVHKAWRLLEWARPGDAVILPLEWPYYDAPDRITDFYLEASTSYYPGYFQAIPWDQRLRLLAALPLSGASARLWSNAGSWWRGWQPARRETRLERFAVLADRGADGREENPPKRGLRPEIAHMSCGKFMFYLQEDGHRPPDAAGLRRLMELLDKLRRRGVQVAFVPPVVGGEDCYVEAATLDAYLAQVRAILAERGFQLLGDPRDFWMGPETILDTYYHLDASARAEATARLLPLLREAGFAAPPAPLPDLAETVVRREREERGDRWPEAMPAGRETPGTDTVRLTALAGWWPVRPEGRWTRDVGAVLRLRPPSGTRALALRLRGPEPARPLEILLDGIVVAQATPGPEEAVVEVPLPPGRDRVELVLRPPAGAPPPPHRGEEAPPRLGVLLLGVTPRA